MQLQNEISDYDIVHSNDTHDDSKSSAALTLDLSGVAKQDQKEVEVTLQLKIRGSDIASNLCTVY